MKEGKRERRKLPRATSTPEWHCPPHWYIVDGKDYGRCQYCPAEKDFRALQKKLKLPDRLDELKRNLLLVKRGKQYERDRTYIRD